MFMSPSTENRLDVVYDFNVYVLSVDVFCVNIFNVYVYIVHVFCVDVDQVFYIHIFNIHLDCGLMYLHWKRANLQSKPGSPREGI